jgi:hypothetical protein
VPELIIRTVLALSAWILVSVVIACGFMELVMFYDWLDTTTPGFVVLGITVAGGLSWLLLAGGSALIERIFKSIRR